MPEGVEHDNQAISKQIALLVTTYQMPEGVEHPQFAVAAGHAREVTTYQMPEGVEHRASCIEVLVLNP